VAEQLIRPTGLLDPEVEVRPVEGQVPDLMEEIRKRTAASERTLVTTLTKRLAEELSRFLQEKGIRVHHLHSEIDTLERVVILRDLRRGTYDCLVGVNLLREGLDLPEVSLVAILDADKEGFLRSETALVQTIGRAARNVHAKVILYADEVTRSMSAAIEETARRRGVQTAYNREHGIRPETVSKPIHRTLVERDAGEEEPEEGEAWTAREEKGDYRIQETVFELEAQMLKAAKLLQFEKAARLRDRILQKRPDYQSPPIASRRPSRKGGRR
jgi:excinuclease ABC subunit B